MVRGFSAPLAFVLCVLAARAQAQSEQEAPPEPPNYGMPDDGERASGIISIEEAQERIWRETGVQVEIGEPFHSYTHGRVVRLLLPSGTPIAGFDFEGKYNAQTGLRDIIDGSTLYERMHEVLRTPVEQLLALREANLAFVEDQKALKQFKIKTNYPIHLGEHPGDRFRKINVMMERCVPISGPEGYMHQPEADLFPVYVRVMQYILGRSDYRPFFIYHKGELLNAVFSEEHRDAIWNRASRNALLERPDSVCASRLQSESPWSETLEKLADELSHIVR